MIFLGKMRRMLELRCFRNALSVNSTSRVGDVLMKKKFAFVGTMISPVLRGDDDANISEQPATSLRGRKNFLLIEINF
jgi:hypothetical protein